MRIEVRAVVEVPDNTPMEAIEPPLPPLNPLHYDDEGVMIGHRLVPMRAPMDGVFWCSVCGGHPDDPIHQAG